jgi:hypothetical protein
MCFPVAATVAHVLSEVGGATCSSLCLWGHICLMCPVPPHAKQETG